MEVGDKEFWGEVFAKGFLGNDPMLEMIFTHQKIPIKGTLFRHNAPLVF